MDVQLLIRLDAEGRVHVQGPLVNRVLCYGMLESARDAIRDYKPPMIEVPDGGANGRIDFGDKR